MNKKYLPIGLTIFAFTQSSIVDVNFEKVNLRHYRSGGVVIGATTYGSVGTLDVTLKITNPNNKPVTIQKIGYGIFCNDEKIGYGDRYEKIIEIPANSSKVVHMPYEFKLATYADCSDYLRNAQSWKIEGTLYITEPKEVEDSFEDRLEVT